MDANRYDQVGRVESPNGKHGMDGVAHTVSIEGDDHGLGANISDEIRLMHLADVHLGYTGSANLVFSDGPYTGRYVREVDIERALMRLRKAIIAPSTHPLVDALLIAGD